MGTNESCRHPFCSVYYKRPVIVFAIKGAVRQNEKIFRGCSRCKAYEMFGFIYL